jgi:hypothetical protein
MKFVCDTHGVTVSIENNSKRIIPPKGSYGNNCKLTYIHHPQEGTFGKCVIKKVS